MNDELARLRSLVGVEAPSTRYALSAASMRYYADSLMDREPSFHADCPRTPPLFFGSAFDLVDMPAGDPRTMFGLDIPVPQGWAVVATGDDFELFRPAAPGTTLKCLERFDTAWEKQGRSGRLLFFTVVKEFICADGTLCLRRRIACAAREPGRTTAPCDGHPAGTPGGADALEGLTVGPIDVRRLAMFATATAEFVDIHYDADHARSLGLPGPIVQGLYKTALIAHMLDRRAATGGGRVVRVTVEHRGMDLAGSILTAGGRISDHSSRKDAALDMCEVWVCNQTGTVTTRGTAVIATPAGPSSTYNHADEQSHRGDQQT
jgi:acyl dehydratase